MSKQTALKWFLDKLPHSIETQFSEQIKQALQMEREQIQDAYKEGHYHLEFDTFNPEQYYNETYGGYNE